MKRRMAREQPPGNFAGLDADAARCAQQFTISSLRIISRLSESLVCAHGLTLFDVLVLDLLARSEHASARMCDLAAAFALTPSRVTQLVGRLEAQGLVDRHRHPVDRRAVLATITCQGRTRLEPAVATYAREIRTHYLNQLTRQQAIALGDVCRRTGLAPQLARPGATAGRTLTAG